MEKPPAGANSYQILLSFDDLKIRDRDEDYKTVPHNTYLFFAVPVAPVNPNAEIDEEESPKMLNDIIGDTGTTDAVASKDPEEEGYVLHSTFHGAVRRILAHDFSNADMIVYALYVSDENGADCKLRESNYIAGEGIPHDAIYVSSAESEKIAVKYAVRVAINSDTHRFHDKNYQFRSASGSNKNQELTDKPDSTTKLNWRQKQAISNRFLLNETSKTLLQNDRFAPGIFHTPMVSGFGRTTERAFYSMDALFKYTLKRIEEKGIDADLWHFKTEEKPGKLRKKVKFHRPKDWAETDPNLDKATRNYQENVEKYILDTFERLSDLQDQRYDAYYDIPGVRRAIVQSAIFLADKYDATRFKTEPLPAYDLVGDTIRFLQLCATDEKEDAAEYIFLRAGGHWPNRSVLWFEARDSDGPPPEVVLWKEREHRLWKNAKYGFLAVQWMPEKTDSSAPKKTKKTDSSTPKKTKKTDSPAEKQKNVLRTRLRLDIVAVSGLIKTSKRINMLFRRVLNNWISILLEANLLRNGDSFSFRTNRKQHLKFLLRASPFLDDAVELTEDEIAQLPEIATANVEFEYGLRKKGKMVTQKYYSKDAISTTTREKAKAKPRREGKQKAKPQKKAKPQEKGKGKTKSPSGTPSLPSSPRLSPDSPPADSSPVRRRIAPTPINDQAGTPSPSSPPQPPSASPPVLLPALTPSLPPSKYDNLVLDWTPIFFPNSRGTHRAPPENED